MIPTLESSRADARVTAIVDDAAKKLYPYLKRLLNHNVYGASIDLGFHFQAGSFSHCRCKAKSPGYSLFMDLESDTEQFQKVYKHCLMIIRRLLVDELRPSSHAVLSLVIELSGGEATISTVADVVSKPGK